jgi:hypothetical protein
MDKKSWQDVQRPYTPRLERQSTFVVLSAFASLHASGQQWIAVVLHPEGGRYSSVHAVTASKQGGWFAPPAPNQTQAGYWQGSGDSWTLLSPPASSSVVYGMNGVTQVGRVSVACLWHGTPESRVDLGAAGMFSEALAVCGNIQAGYVQFPGDNNYHACLWRGTAASFVDLHQPGALRSYVYATDGVLQGGEVRWPGPVIGTAAIWAGTAQSYVNLGPPPPYQESAVHGMAPGVQVGDVWVSGEGPHAALWRGTLESWMDLNPLGVPASTSFRATTGRVHVGQGVIDGSGGAAHALVNFGTRDSWVDLHQFLPATYQSFSRANAVYQDGDTIYVGGYAYGVGGRQEAILWIGTVPCYANCDQSAAAPALNVLDFACFINRFSQGDPYANCDRSSTAPSLNVLDFNCFLNRFAGGCP